MAQQSDASTARSNPAASRSAIAASWLGIVPATSSGLGVIGAPGDDREQLVRRHFHVLIGVGVGDELARGIRLRPGEQDHPHAAGAGNEILGLGRIRPVRLEPSANEALLLLGLGDVLAEGPRQLRIARHPRRDAHLHECLFLDRMDVGEVLHELFLEGLGHGVLTTPGPTRHSPHVAGA